MTPFSPDWWIRRPSVAVLALAVVGCGGDSAGLHSPVAAAVRMVSGDKQSGTVGSALAQSIVVEVMDASGAPVPGSIVTFTVTAGGGTVSGTSAAADASGRATTQWTIGTKAGDAQQLTVSVESSASVPALAISATAVAGSPVALDAPPSISGRAGLALPPITVVLRDRYGNLAPTTGIRILPRLDATSSQSLIGAIGIPTDAAGAIITGLSITGKAGAATLVLDADGMTSGRVSVALGGGAPVRTQVFGSGAIDATAGAAGPPIAATPIDAWDNPVANVDVTFAVDGVGVIGHATSGSDGVATLSTWTAPALGNYRLTATAAGASSAQYSLTTHRPPPATLTPSPSNLTAGPAGSELVLDVKATDAAGNPVPDTFLTWSSGAKHGGGNTDNTGVAHLDVQLDTKVGAMPVQVQAGPNVSATMTVQITHAQFAKIIGPDSLSAPVGTGIAPTWTATDIYGNPVAGQPLYAEIQTGLFVGPPSSTSSVTTGADGSAQFPMTLGPYAGVQFLAIYDAPGGPFRGETVIYRTAARGSTWAEGGSCVYQAGVISGISTIGVVFGPNGHPASGIALTFSVQPGNGYLVTNLDPFTHLSSYVGTSDANGDAWVNWNFPAGPGTYHMFVQGPPGYDGAPPGDFVCHLG